MPALSSFGIPHVYEGLLVGCGLAAEPPSLSSWSDCLRACESKSESVRERESTPAVVLFGLLCQMLSASAVVGRMGFVYVFIDVSV